MLLKNVTKEVKKLFRLKSSTASVQRQEEIFHLKRLLEDFGIQFSNLAYGTSSVERQSLIEISKTVAQNKELLSILNSEMELAAQQQSLAKRIGITPKILEEHHQYIVTMAHILSGPYPHLREYLKRSIT